MTQELRILAALLFVVACEPAARVSQAHEVPRAPVRRQPVAKPLPSERPLELTEARSPFQLVAAGTFSLHALRDRVWMSAADDGLAFAELRGAGFVRDERLALGVQRCASWQQLALTETQKDELWLFDDHHPWSACPPPARLFRRSKSGNWKLHGMIRAHWLDMGSWTFGSTLIAEVPLRSGPPWGYTLRTMGGARAPTPKQWSRAPKSGECWTELEFPLALFSNAAGEALVVAVSRCEPSRDESGGGDESGETDGDPAQGIELAVAERFNKDGTSARVALPVSLESNAAVVGRGPDAVWTIGTDAEDRTALVRGSSRGFEITDYLPRGARVLDADAEGNVWTLHDGALAQRSPQGAWRRVPLPAGAGTVVALHASSAADVWLVLDNGVYRTLTTEPFVAAPRECTDEEATRFEVALSVPAPGSARRAKPGPHAACAR